MLQHKGRVRIEDANAIHNHLRSMVAYPLRLEERMEQCDFPRDDKLFVLTKNAHDAVHELFLETHEMGSKGVGRRPK